jgi:hypothetical protein
MFDEAVDQLAGGEPIERCVVGDRLPNGLGSDAPESSRPAEVVAIHALTLMRLWTMSNILGNIVSLPGQCQ